MKAKVALSLALLLLLLSPSLAAADYYTGFDQYANNQTFPPSAGLIWTQTYDSNAYKDCFAGTSVTSYTVNSAVGSAFSSPNTFAFVAASNATCFIASHYVRMTMLVNQTTNSAALNFMSEIVLTAGTNTTYTATVSLCGTAYSGYGLDHLTVYWQKNRVFSTTAPGSCTVYIQLATVMGAAAHQITWQIDNLVEKGGNAILSNADIFLEQLQSTPYQVNPWFNITDFTGSRVVVNYTSGPSYIIGNMTAPDVYAPLANAILITVYVGFYCTASGACTAPYYRSMIPTSTTHQVCYLDNPITTTVVQFEFQVADFSGQFSGAKTGTVFTTGTSTSASSTVMTDTNANYAVNQFTGDYIEYTSGPAANQIRYIASNTAHTITSNTFAPAPTGGGGDTFKVISLSLGTVIILKSGSFVVASSYTDSNSFAGEGLPPGNYEVVLTKGSATFTASVNLVPTDIANTITVPSIQISYPADTQTALYCAGLWGSSTTILAKYNDSTTTSTSVTIKLLQVNASGTFYVAQGNYSSGPYGTITQSITNASVHTGYHIWLKYSTQYSVVCGLTNTFGSLTFPSVNGQPVVGGQAGPTSLAIPDVLHIGAFLPGVTTPTNQIAGLTILTIIGAAFSEFFGPIGFVILAFFTAYLTSSGWILVTGTAAMVFVVMGIAGLLVWLERRNR